MSAIRVRLKRGADEIEVEGSQSEINSILKTWWSNLEGEVPPPKNRSHQPKPSSKERSNRSSSQHEEENSGGFDSSRFANELKESAEFALLEKEVLHKKSLFNKIALVCFHASGTLSSGQIVKALVALDVKVDIGNVSNCIKKNSGKFLSTNARKAGSTKTQYRLTSQARTNFQSWLDQLKT